MQRFSVNYTAKDYLGRITSSSISLISNNRLTAIEQAKAWLKLRHLQVISVQAK